jgi:putative FmdB family regulatory protein
MPIYEYACRACAHDFEALVFGSERAACPSCGTTDVEKRFSAFATHGAPRPGSADALPPGSCGSCGDPRGPGSCAR